VRHRATLGQRGKMGTNFAAQTGRDSTCSRSRPSEARRSFVTSTASGWDVGAGGPLVPVLESSMESGVRIAVDVAESGVRIAVDVAESGVRFAVDVAESGVRFAVDVAESG
jgi:hypothetical protein